MINFLILTFNYLYVIEITNSSTLNVIDGIYSPTKPFATLLCKSNITLNLNEELFWYIHNNQTLIHPPTYDIIKYSRDNISLKINRINKENIGEVYSCKKINSQTKAIIDQQLVRLFASPVMMGDASLSLTLYEGESYNLSCSGYGYPLPDPIWKRKSLKPIIGIVNLYITAFNSFEYVLYSNYADIVDRGEYTCHSSNQINKSWVYSPYFTVYLRVKSTQDYLYPLSVIFTEIFLIVFIVLVNELNTIFTKHNLEKGENDEHQKSNLQLPSSN